MGGRGEGSGGAWRGVEGSGEGSKGVEEEDGGGGWWRRVEEEGGGGEDGMADLLGVQSACPI